MHWATSLLRMRCKLPARAGFTLVELLVVMGILAMLISLLLPAVNAVRKRTRAIQCASNLRHLGAALLCYANDNRGRFPLNLAALSPGRCWYDQDRAGKFLPGTVSSLKRGTGGGVLACPDDPSGKRSYAMNVWASSKIDSGLMPIALARGTFWNAGVAKGSQMILIIERWSSIGSVQEDAWYATATVGLAGETPGQRFGAGRGIVPPLAAGRWGAVGCELPYSRHDGVSTPTVRRGLVNVAYADGHVAMKEEKVLADFTTGLSTLDSLWSPLDPMLNK